MIKVRIVIHYHMFSTNTQHCMVKFITLKTKKIQLCILLLTLRDNLVIQK